MKVQSQMDETKAAVINAAFQRTGIPFRFEFLTPDSVLRELEQNQALLAEDGLSQAMSGEGSSSTPLLDAMKGRPFMDTLVKRLVGNQWREYFGIVSRTPSGAVIDGITRMLAIYKSGKGAWVLTYNAADPKDFYMFDDEASARIAKDVFKNAGYSTEVAGVLSIIVPKAAGSVNKEEGTYQRVMRDLWWAYFLDRKAAFLEAVHFVKKERGEFKVPRKNLAALMYYHFVSRTGARNTTKAKSLLEAYKAGNWVPGDNAGKAMATLARFFVEFKAELHERNQCMPLFYKVMKTLLANEPMFEYNVRETKGINGSTFQLVYKEKAKAAAAGHRK